MPADAVDDGSYGGAHDRSCRTNRNADRHDFSAARWNTGQRGLLPGWNRAERGEKRAASEASDDRYLCGAGLRAPWQPKRFPSCGGGTLLGTVSVGANGIAILTITSLPVGTDNITAIYSGNGTLDVSTSDPVTVTITPAATTTTTIAISPNPGFDGQSVTLTGTVSPVPTGSPLGTITFCDSGSVGPTVRRTASQYQLEGPARVRLFHSEKRGRQQSVRGGRCF